MLEVREFIVDMQKYTISKIDKKFNGIILEGRDCGTVIAPFATLKIFLTANLDIRAKRRYEQFISDGKIITYTQVYNDLLQRDGQD